ncbi:MAG: ABC transporter substrate-binding protein [Clostridia bacterium]|nr:ABC transporter substrate-binding protein [Clostridia bacterium]
MYRFIKKTMAFLCVLALVLGAALAEGADLRVVALKGPTAMGLVKLMSEDERARFDIVAAVDEVAPLLVKGEADVACVPANLASVLYNNTDGAVQVVAINTLGVLYIVEKGEGVQSVADLAGRTIYASGKGATPEYALNYILKENGIDPAADVDIEWKSEHAECLAALTASDAGVAMLPQPFVTTALMKSEGLRVALDLTAEWDRLGVDSSLITGVAVARRAFAEEHPDALDAFLDGYAASVEWVNANTEAAAKLVGEYDIVPEQVAVQALPACNITFIAGDEMKEKLSGYLAVLLEAEPKAVGGALPGEDFYYDR